MNIKSSKLLLGVYLFIVGILAVNIHIQMTNWGVAYPQWQPTQWINMFIFVIQSLGILWLSLQLVRWKPSISFAQHIGIAFVTMAAIQELFIRLPLTAGYTVDQKYLFVWVLSYLPELLATFVITLAIVSFQRCLAKRYNLFFTAIVVIFYSVGVHLWLTPFLQEITAPLAQLLTPPSESGVLSFPYPKIVDIIASVTFIEPMIAAYFICYLIGQNGTRNLKMLLPKTIAALLILTQSGAKFVFYMWISTIDDLMDRLLSISQFTLEWVFIGVAVSLAVAYSQSRKSREVSLANTTD
ncbi:hypothetical protein [Vibrio pectenicida]|uniref:Uncharacterized protein n=1 Tax=Vibrio pectenicida TaxID=62763 RepID=A0A3R9G2B9_9VIBR|nr:hypothetical protein [Vibrio pectenicida]RSD30663.1 hypothetical protein EJA03_12730 [Vibrio pectenicida]